VARWVTFDCYGTLVDWETPMHLFLRDYGGRFDEWERVQFRLLAGPYRPYRKILAESVRRVAPRAPAHRAPEVFAESPPFPDTRPALERLRAAGFRLGVISNTDRDLIARTLEPLGVPFDAVVTAQDARAYKPDRAVFAHALRTIGASAEDCVHVAFGFEYDLAPARACNMRVVWLNRKGEPLPPGAPSPDLIARDLEEAARLLGA
jgi:2-haloalkanoic acid dehalogenase type II